MSKSYLVEKDKKVSPPSPTLMYSTPWPPEETKKKKNHLATTTTPERRKHFPLLALVNKKKKQKGDDGKISNEILVKTIKRLAT